VLCAKFATVQLLRLNLYMTMVDELYCQISEQNVIVRQCYDSPSIKVMYILFDI
jgi:hypothetical protein